MSNTLQQNSSYAGAVKVLQDEETNKTNKASLTHNIIKCVLYIAALVFLMWVYFRWQRISVRNHAFRAEFIASADSSANRLRAVISITDPKVLDIDSIYNTKSGDRNAIKYRDYFENCKITFAHKPNIAYPIFPNSKGLVSEYIGLPVYNNLSDSCKHHNTYIERFTDVFYFEHLDNERLPYKFYKKDTINFYKTRIYFVEKNRFFDIDSSNLSPFSLYHFNLANTSISDRIVFNTQYYKYRNITQSLVLTPYGLGYCPYSHYKIKMPSKFWRFLSSVFSMEDISQSYYNLTLTSQTIPELLVRINFVGTIDCYYTHNNNIDHLESIRDDINIGRSFIEVLKKNDGSKTKEKLVLVKFNDMQNMQTTRLFILGVLITLTLTKLLGVSWRILRNPLMKLWLSIKRFISKLFNQKTVVSKNNDQSTDDDIPGFYL